MQSSCRFCFYTAQRSLRRSINSKSEKCSESPLRHLIRDASRYGEVGTASRPAEGELQWATQPYATKINAEEPPYTDPKEATVLLFPGQGSQYVGMGRLLQDVPAARDLYELASSIVGWDVARVCREGPAAELERRCHTAVAVTALGALERARERRPGAVERVRAAAGFSAGEFAALVFAGALPLDAALRLLELRAEAERAAIEGRACAALAVRLAPDAALGALLAEARAACAADLADPVCEVAAYLSPGRKVLAGDERALRYVEREGRARGVHGLARLRASFAPPCALMARAEAAAAEALRAVPLRAPRVAVVSCLDARAHGGAGALRRRLARLGAAPVRWEQALHALYARARTAPQPLTLALGPGAAVRASLRAVNARAWDSSVQIDA